MKKIFPVFGFGLKFEFLKLCLSVAAICGTVIMAVCPFSCRMTEEGVVLIKGDLSSPSIVSWRVASGHSVEIVFSEKVKLGETAILHIQNQNSSDGDLEDTAGETTGKADNLDNAGDGEAGGSTEIKLARLAKNSFAPYLALSHEKLQGVSAVYSDDGYAVTLLCDEKFETGAHYTIFSEISDSSGNTLTFALPFIGYNDKMPEIFIAGVHPKYTSSNRKDGKVYKNEFVELYAATSGNLSGIEIVSAVDGEDKKFVLPSIDVKVGTFVTVHLRSRGEDCVSETMDNLSLCTQEYASDKCLDLWSENLEARLGDTQDVIILRNVWDRKILDALMYAPAGSTSWQSDALKAAASEVCAAGLWTSDLPAAVVPSDDLTASKMILRKGVSGGHTGADDWTIVPVISGSGKKRLSNLGTFAD